MNNIYKENYDKVIKGIDGSIIVLFRMFIMNLTKRGEEWRFSDNHYESIDDDASE